MALYRELRRYGAHILPPPHRRRRLAQSPGTTLASVCDRRVSSAM
jgi:hypothetical protein